MIAEFPSRTFQAWDFTVSHGSLLIRSPRGQEDLENADVCFVGVEFMSIPRTFKGLRIVPGSDRDAVVVAPLAGAFSSEAKVFLLRSEGRTGIVVAADCSVSMNDRDIFDVPWRTGDQH